MAVDLERRRAAMERSQKLGHCVCNLKQPCPCPELVERNICHCAGERPERKSGDVALTKLVRKAGCASKIGQADLLQIVRNLPASSDPNVLLGAAAGDDAGIYRLDDRRSLVQTVDVFTPCVDDPYLFGQIAAANSVSDVYAMGGRPLTALSIIGFPIDELDGPIMEAILRGGIDKLEEAGCALLGGRSINDPEIKCGFAVTGLIDTDRVVARDRAVPGDALVLTKALGTGMVSFAASLGHATGQAIAEVGASMAMLNKDAAELMLEFGAHACTDVTGYGLAGHLVSMVRGSGANAVIDMSEVPVFSLVPECIVHGLMPGAVDRNQAYAMGWIRVEDPDGPGGVPVLYDPQTSGGLLIALPEDEANRLVAELRRRGHLAASIIGHIEEKDGPEGRIVITNRALHNFFGTPESIIMPEEPRVDAAAPADCCCPSEEAKPAVEASGLAAFKEFMHEANTPMLIDRRPKKLTAIALSIAVRCQPCAIIHIKGALAMGITRPEIDEAAALAIAFGGCSAMMLYKEVWEEIERQV